MLLMHNLWGLKEIKWIDKFLKFFDWAFQVALVVRNPPAKAGDARDMDLITASGKSPGVGNDNPLQCSCLENSMDKGAW